MSSPRVEGRANHGNLTLRSVPRVGILIIRDVPGVGNFDMLPPWSPDWSGERGEDLEMTYLGKYPEGIWLNFPPSCQSNGWTKGEWYMDLVASKETMSFLTPVSYLSLKVYNTMFFLFIIYKSLLPAWHHFNRCSALSLWHKKQKICVFLNVEWFVPGSCQIWWKLESYPMVSILNLKPKSWLKS